MEYRDVFKRVVVEWLEKPLPELVERDIKLKFDSSAISAIIGPRRVGKTSLMLYAIKQLLGKAKREDIIFVDFEDNRLSGISSNELDELFVAHREVTNTEPKYVFFDEIQEAPKWSKFVRRLHNSGKYFIAVSGSSSKLLSGEIATELRGRYKSTLLLPFSFGEMLRLKGFEYGKKTEFSEKKGRLLSLLNEFITQGGFPGILKKQGAEDKKELVKAYYETMFYKDIVERYKVKSTDVMEILMNYALDNNATIFSVTSFGKILEEKGIKASKKTASLYLKHLEDTFFILSSQKFSYSAKTRALNPKKIYLLDNAFQTFLSTNFTPNKGKMLEATVMQELKRRGMETYYFKGNNECDFIAKKDQKMEAIQVTYELSQSNKEREIKGLVEAMRQTNSAKGTIITFNQEQEIKSKNAKIKVIPLWKWLLENQQAK